MKLLLIYLLIFIGCQYQTTNFKELNTPSKNGGESNLFISETNETYLSWVEYQNDTIDALLFSKLENDVWTTPREIVRGNNWFVNWADFPSLVSYKNGGESIAAHWLQKSTAGIYDYDVHIIQSQDFGETWDDEFIIHRDSIAAEHGFMTMIPLSNDRIFATWLDGRNTKNEGHHHHGAMTLRTAEFDIGGHIFAEAELDNRICDCCQTDAAMTDQGIVVVYRDRNEHEIRDISIVRKVEGEWTKPNLVHADNWEIAGCPVNGPAIDALNDQVVVAWFTAAKEIPRVKIAFSNDSGQTFENPIIISEKIPLGRVDIELINEKEAVVSWLEERDSSAVILAKKVTIEGEISEQLIEVETSSSRQSGFPIMKYIEKRLIFSWTATGDTAKVKTGILNL